ncbi:MAG: Flp family type IVb pilin [Roseibium sp.]|uniref:Flp family type IVb pilin n=1 Tax=Roseibium sp. TaxID=1936156 RepID=UPI001B263A09|nr:Flp family type IVb pilin [Roseibium sp.]MBO6510754.1 Flp family type IVb pilin [Roseibium sp.]MBO6891993.1 Flp family type IVb pilin [Roseibium sp.]MBO6931976.1 Flp family type IVb pilin [Roseibium sp.]
MNGKSQDEKSVKHLLNRFVRDESGATAMEYGMIVAILSVIIIAGIGAIGQTTRDQVFGAVINSINVVLSM